MPGATFDDTRGEASVSMLSRLTWHLEPVGVSSFFGARLLGGRWRQISFEHCKGRGQGWLANFWIASTVVWFARVGQHFLPQVFFWFSLCVVSCSVCLFGPIIHVQDVLQIFATRLARFLEGVCHILYMSMSKQLAGNSRLCRVSEVSKINKNSLQRPWNDA